ncbi:MAG: hypothetical protein FGM55_05905, partial [Rhodoferax sp.]|nr:hypothetical protein [Rhodoferax sp.]
MPRNAKRLIAIAGDSALCLLSVVLAFYLRLGEWPISLIQTLLPMVLSVALALPIFIKAGLY